MRPDFPIALYMQLSKQLKSLLAAKGISITSLAKQARVPAQTLHNWMSGAKPRDFDQVKRVADRLEVSLDFILYGIESARPQPITEFLDEIHTGTFEVILRRPKKS